MTDDTLGSRMRYARELKHLSQADLANKTGISKGAISMSERDVTSLTVDNLGKICQALQVSADYMVFGTVSPLVGSGWDRLMSSPEGVGLRTVVENLHTDRQLESVFLLLSKLKDGQRSLLMTMAQTMAQQNTEQAEGSHGETRPEMQTSHR